MKLTIVFLLLATSARAQFTVEEMLKPYVYTNETGEAFAYRMSVPQFPLPGKAYPLILFLHGSGECGTDNQRQIKVGLPSLMATLLKRPEPVIVVAPQCQPGNGWIKQLAREESYAMSKEPAASLEVAIEVCRHVAATRQADMNRLYITGLSLGGFGTWDAIQREPDLFAAAIPICGGGDTRRVQGIKKMPVWVFHGADDVNVAVACSRRMVEALKLAGSRKVRYTEYEKATHNVWDRTYANPEVIDWLLQQSRAKTPWWRFW
ncbi:MAG: prolyl oligopeptidase family serine peptidase [bacterium]